MHVFAVLHFRIVQPTLAYETKVTLISLCTYVFPALLFVMDHINVVLTCCVSTLGILNAQTKQVFTKRLHLGDKDAIINNTAKKKKNR